MTARHRNNAAEWVLWLVLLPVVPIVWLANRIGQRTCNSADENPMKPGA